MKLTALRLGVVDKTAHNDLAVRDVGEVLCQGRSVRALRHGLRGWKARREPP
jgi:hypothetical protein